MRFIKNQKGVTLIEIVVTMAIIGVITVPFMTLFSTSYNINAKTDKLIDAKFLAQEYMERIQAIPYSTLVSDMGFVENPFDNELLEFHQDSDVAEVKITVSPYVDEEDYKYSLLYQNPDKMIPSDYEFELDLSENTRFSYGEIYISFVQYDDEISMDIKMESEGEPKLSIDIEEAKPILFYYDNAIASSDIYVENKSSLDIEFYCINKDQSSENVFPVFKITEGSFTSRNIVTPKLSVDELAIAELASLGSINKSTAYFVDITVNIKGESMQLQGIKTID